MTSWPISYCQIKVKANKFGADKIFLVSILGCKAGRAPFTFNFMHFTVFNLTKLVDCNVSTQSKAHFAQTFLMWKITKSNIIE